MRIPYLKKLIPNSGSRGQKKNIGPRIRFRNTAQDYDLPGENLSFLRIFQIFFLLLNMFAFFPDMIQTNHIGEWRPVTWSRPITAASWLASTGILTDHNASGTVTWHTSPPNHIAAWCGGLLDLDQSQCGRQTLALSFWPIATRSGMAFRMLQANRSCDASSTCHSLWLTFIEGLLDVTPYRAEMI